MTGAGCGGTPVSEAEESVLVPGERGGGEGGGEETSEALTKGDIIGGSSAVIGR